MAPIHLKLFSGKGFKTDKGSPVFISLPDGFKIIAENGFAAGVSDLDKTLPDDLCADVRLGFKEKIYLIFKWVQFAGAVKSWFFNHWVFKIFFNCFSSNMKRLCDFSDRKTKVIELVDFKDNACGDH